MYALSYGVTDHNGGVTHVRISVSPWRMLEEDTGAVPLRWWARCLSSRFETIIGYSSSIYRCLYIDCNVSSSFGANTFCINVSISSLCATLRDNLFGSSSWCFKWNTQYCICWWQKLFPSNYCYCFFDCSVVDLSYSSILRARAIYLFLWSLFFLPV